MASYVLNEDMFQRTRRAVRTVENQVTPANGPSAGSGREYNAGISAYNAATEIIPAYGCVRIQGGGWLGDNRTRTLTVVKPSSTVSTTYALNGPSSIDAAKWGVVYAEGLCLALYDGTAPECGDTLGPVSDTWTLSASGSPRLFTVYGVVDSTNKIALGRIQTTSQPLVGEYHQSATIIWDDATSHGSHLITPDHDGTPSYTSVLDCAAIENLAATCTSWQAPCLRLLQDGLWKFTVSMNCAAALIQNPETAGVITWDAWPWIAASAVLAYQNGGSGSYSSLIPWANADVRFGHKTDFNAPWTTVVAVQNLDAGTNLRMTLGAACSDSADNSTNCSVDTYIFIERLGDKTE